jgi:hypothetical protein
MHPVQYRGLGMKFNLFFVLFTFLAHRFLPKYDARMQLLMFQIRMLRDRIDDQRFIDRLMRSEKCEVTVAGSLLPSPDEDTASPLTGRIVSWEIFPLSFREFLDGKGIESDGPLSPKQRLTIQKAFEDYWRVGGVPVSTDSTSGSESSHIRRTGTRFSPASSGITTSPTLGR